MKNNTHKTSRILWFSIIAFPLSQLQAESMPAGRVSQWKAALLATWQDQRVKVLVGISAFGCVALYYKLLRAKSIYYRLSSAGQQHFQLQRMDSSLRLETLWLIRKDFLKKNGQSFFKRSGIAQDRIKAFLHDLDEQQFPVVSVTGSTQDFMNQHPEVKSYIEGVGKEVVEKYVEARLEEINWAKKN